MEPGPNMAIPFRSIRSPVPITNEFFTELNVPLVSGDMNVPLIHSLELQGAARYVRNSMTGGFWTYTGGGKYAPFKA